MEPLPWSGQPEQYLPPGGWQSHALHQVSHQLVEALTEAGFREISINLKKAAFKDFLRRAL